MTATGLFPPSATYMRLVVGLTATACGLTPPPTVAATAWVGASMAVATTALVEPSMTETVFFWALATKMRLVVGLTATASGPPPTPTVATTVPGGTKRATTRLLPASATYTFPAESTATPYGPFRPL